MGFPAQIVTGSSTNGLANVDGGYNLNTTLPVDGQFAGLAIAAGQVDGGEVLTREARPIEVDTDYKIRCAGESLQDVEVFNYSAQNTGKHNLIATTMAASFGASGFTTNSGSITTINTGVQLRTYAMFPLLGSTSLYSEFRQSFSAAIVTNTTIVFGLGITAAAVPFTPADGAFFRLTSSGLVAVISFAGTETVSAVIAFTGIDGSAQYTPGKKYKFNIEVSESRTTFWINDITVAKMATPVGQNRPFAGTSACLFMAHAIGGTAASAAFQVTLAAYVVSLGGPNPADTLAVVGNRIHGGYQGLSGGTMGSLANYANSANPTAAVPTNTTAVLGAGLGGQFWETATLAVTPVDGIIWSYQVPMGTVNVQGRRLSLKGIYHMSFIQTVIAGGPFVAQYSLAWGHTNVSLATTESATAKAPRRIALPPFTQVVTAAQAVSTLVSQPGGSFIDLGDAGIIVNPGEFIALVVKHIGTVGSSGVIAHVSQPVYGWI